MIPAHNEATRLPETLRRYGRAAADRYGANLEIVVVPNGCSDDTAAVARSMRTEVPGIRVVDIAAPIGKGGAVIEGLRQARGARVAFADADGATDAESLFGLVDALDGSDVVIGSRRLPGSQIVRAQPLRRRVASRLFNGAVRLLFGLNYSDTQCGAKAFTGDAAHRLAEMVTEQWWAFDIDLLLAARRLGLSIAQRPVVWTDADGSQLKMGSAAPEVLTSLGRLVAREWLPWLAPRWGRRPLPERPRRILALNWRCLSHPESGGAELNLFEQARRWSRDGNDVTVVAAQRGGGAVLPAHEVVDGVEVRRMGGRFSLYARAAWYLMWHGHEYDLILDVANGVPFFTPLFTGTPSVLLVHHVSDRQWFEEFARPIAAVGCAVERFIVPLVYRGRRAIAVSPTTRDALVETGFAAEQISVVYNGTPGVEAADQPESAGVPRGRLAPTVAYVGRLKRYKKLDRLIRAIAGLRSEFPAVRLVMAGDGDAAPELRALVRSLDLDEAVTFHGFVDEPTKSGLLDDATVFATPSMQEGWGLSVLEANARGCPAVAFDVPGLRSAIVDGETGFLAADEAEFREAIARLLRDPELRSEMSSAARRWASRFDWETASRQTLAILESAAEATPDKRLSAAA